MMSSAADEEPGASFELPRRISRSSPSRYAAWIWPRGKRWIARATAGISDGRCARHRYSSKKFSASPELPAIAQARDLPQRGVVLVDRRHQRIGADPRREIELDPLEQLARMTRLDERHQLDGADLQRHAGQRGGVGEHLRALAAVGRHLRASSRGGAAPARRRRACRPCRAARAATPCRPWAARTSAAARRLRTPAGRSPRPRRAARSPDRGAAACAPRPDLVRQSGPKHQGGTNDGRGSSHQWCPHHQTTAGDGQSAPTLQIVNQRDCLTTDD